MSAEDDLTLDDLDPELLALLGAGAPPAAPPGSLRAALLDAVSSPDPRVALAGFAGRLERLFDLAPAAVDALLSAVARPAEWEPYVEGVGLLHFEPGPRVASGAARVDAGLVRFRAGLAYPRHRHVGDEVMLILAGGLVEDVSQRRAVAGDLLHMGPGTEHGFRILPGAECVAAVLLHGGLPEFV
ncbi:MAG: hypothetical protein IT374_18080 [Polyangiaceae bacterium]|nr:hypothetical protein [Polyangiaceae bacterium]